MQRSSLLATIAACLLVAVTLPLYFTVAALSFMAFDAPTEEFMTRAATFVAVVVLLSIAIPAGSLYGGIRLIRNRRTVHGMLVSLVPALVLLVFWAWLSMQ